MTHSGSMTKRAARVGQADAVAPSVKVGGIGTAATCYGVEPKIARLAGKGICPSLFSRFEI